MGIIGAVGSASSVALTPARVRVQMIHLRPVLVDGVWGLEAESRTEGTGALKDYDGVTGLDVAAASSTGRTVVYDRVGGCAGLL